MVQVAFTEHHPRPNVWRYTAECPVCRAVYVERAEFLFPDWITSERGKCPHFRGTDPHTDKAIFQEVA